MSGFTPGPWTVVDGCYPGLREISGPSLRLSYWTIATDITLEKAEQRERDARLISAAPELVDALEDAYRFITQPARMATPKDGPKTATYRTENYSALTTKLRAAIAKARGDSPNPPPSTVEQIL